MAGQSSQSESDPAAVFGRTVALELTAAGERLAVELAGKQRGQE